MASTNFKLFDENKTNMMSDTEYNINTQRLNGVQAGIASSQLQNKTLYQTSLVAYSLAQIMMQNGYDANDSAVVSSFVGNMSNSLLQKVLDKATSDEAQAGTITNKWISPATLKAASLLLSGGTMSGPISMGNNKITNLAGPTADSDAANKKYVDDHVPSVPPKSQFDGWTKIGTITTNRTGTFKFNNMPGFANQFLMSIETNTENTAVHWGNASSGGIDLTSKAGGIVVCNAFRTRYGTLDIYVYGTTSTSNTGVYIGTAKADSIRVTDGTGGRFSLYYR